MIIENYEPKAKIEYDQKRIASNINEVTRSMLDFYVSPDTTFELHKQYWYQKLNEELGKYSKRSRSVAGIEDENEMFKRE